MLLVEAGGVDAMPWIHVPVGYFKTIHNPAVDWCYKTEPETGWLGPSHTVHCTCRGQSATISAGLNQRAISWPRGKVLGGSSSLNGLL